MTWGQAEPPKPAQIVFNDSGGDMQKAMRKAFYSEFEKQYGIRVVRRARSMSASCAPWCRAATSNGT